MANAPDPASLEALLEQWRNHCRRHAPDQLGALPRWEDQLRVEIAGLTRAGLAGDEAFLIAVKRLGAGNAATGEFAREQSDRVWTQPAAVDAGSGERGPRARTEAVVAFSLAVVAAMAVKLPALFGFDVDRHEAVYIRNAGVLVLPCLVGYFVWQRRLAAGVVRWLAAAFALAAVVANAPGWGQARGYEALMGLHLPIALLLAVGIAHAGGRWGEVGRRMDFIRFTGELFIYYVLIALGGGVLCAFMALTFTSIGIRIDSFLGTWLVPCGAAGAVLVASWLVEAKKGVIGSIAPMLTRLFTPLFAVMLLAFLGAVLFSGRGVDLKRELLIGFDLLLVVVLGLLLYSLAARHPQAPPGAFDVLQVVLLISALLADLVALWAIGARISEFGFSPNRVAALGENVILLVNLGWSAVLYVRFLLRRGAIADLERWQTAYLPVYAAWAAVVVIGFPPAFRWLG